MLYTRRQAIRTVSAAAGTLAAQGSLLRLAAQQTDPASTRGHFTASRQSLKTYTIPDWFADAKFGIWSHWGPQSAVGDGDWYAHWMYFQGHPQNRYHVKRFGPPSKFGYKDTAIPLFTADKWDPEHLMDLYQKAGAKYFFSLAVHHDNYDLWNSKHQPRWNAVVSGPKRDIVGLWGSAARRRGLRFGVSEHLSASFNWFATSHGSDATGEFAGVPYDGADPAFADLYHDYRGLGPIVLKEPGKSASFKEPTAWRSTSCAASTTSSTSTTLTCSTPTAASPTTSTAWRPSPSSTMSVRLDIHGTPEAVYFSKKHHRLRRRPLRAGPRVSRP